MIERLKMPNHAATLSANELITETCAGKLQFVRSGFWADCAWDVYICLECGGVVAVVGGETTHWWNHNVSDEMMKYSFPASVRQDIAEIRVKLAGAGDITPVQRHKQPRILVMRCADCGGMLVNNGDGLYCHDSD